MPPVAPGIAKKPPSAKPATSQPQRAVLVTKNSVRKLASGPASGTEYARFRSMARRPALVDDPALEAQGKTTPAGCATYGTKGDDADARCTRLVFVISLLWALVKDLDDDDEAARCPHCDKPMFLLHPQENHPLTISLNRLNNDQTHWASATHTNVEICARRENKPYSKASPPVPWEIMPGLLKWWRPCM